MTYLVTYGRLDGTAVKQSSFSNRIYALKLANNIAFVFLDLTHPFKKGDRGTARHEANGFFVQVEEVVSGQLQFAGSITQQMVVSD